MESNILAQRNNDAGMLAHDFLPNSSLRHGESPQECDEELSRRSHYSPISSLRVMKPVLTPATMSSAGSSPASHRHTSPRLSRRSGPAASTATAPAAGTGAFSMPTLSPSSRVSVTLHIPLPSPSRKRLDTRYAARLATTPTSSSSPSSSSAASMMRQGAPATEEADLMPPPSITTARSLSRNMADDINDLHYHSHLSVFRPSPICTSTLTSWGDASPVSLTTAINTGSATNNLQQQLPYSPLFFPSSVISSSSSSYSPSPSSSCVSASGVTTRMGGLLSPHHYSGRRSTKRSASDVGASDRFIPSRATSNFNFNLWEGVAHQQSARRSAVVTPGGDTARSNQSSSHGNHHHHANNNSNGASSSSSNNGNQQHHAMSAEERDEADSGPNGSNSTTAFSSQQSLLNTLLRSELLGDCENAAPSTYQQQSGYQGRSSSSTPLREGVTHLRYQSPRQLYQENVFEDAVGPTAFVNSFSLTPVRSAASQRLMQAPQKRKRRISKVPFKVLDAPALQDDFYLNLVDWSSQNVLAVGLGSCVYLWSACTSKVTKLCDLAATEDLVTSVSWAQRGTHLAVGTNRGEVQIWDSIKCKRVRSMAGHVSRVGTLAWTGPILASGSRDRLIFLRDVRVQAAYTDKLNSHKQEVCGLKWSFDDPSFLASGGNDNHLHVIDSRNPATPIHKFSEHTAAVKAIAWSPHQHGLLASGGGTADRCIRFWNTLSGTSLNRIDTGSQVCNLAWSQNCNEIVSTHGYSLNQIVVWRYPSMSKVVTLTGHTYRVLYLAMSPDGSTVVTGAGDETLRFWQIFPGPRSDGKEGSGGLLFPNTLGSVIR